MRYLPEWDGWRQKRVLLAPLRYYSAIIGGEIVIPTGFVFDGESRPTAGFVTGRDCVECGAVHDYGYQAHRYELATGGIIEAFKWLCDEVYREALLAYRLEPFYCDQRYRMVTCYGGSAYETGLSRLRILSPAELAAATL